MIVRRFLPAWPLVVALGALWLLWNATPNFSLPQNLTLLSLPIQVPVGRPQSSNVVCGWQNVPIHEGTADVRVETPRDAAVEFDEFVLISALGSPTDCRSVRVSCEISEQVGDETGLWTPIVRKQPSLSGTETNSDWVERSRFDAGLVERIPVETISQNQPSTVPRPTLRTPQFPRVSGGAWSTHATETLPCEVAWSSRTCRIWHVTDEPFDARSQAWAEQVGRMCTDRVLPAVQQFWGHWPDVDGDGVLNLLMTERVMELGAEVQACVRQQDFRAAGDSEWTQPWDVIYLRPGQDLDELAAILQHELTHVAQFSWCRQLCGSQPWPVPDWITEGLAHATEIRLANGAGTTNLEDRLEAFAATPAHTPLVVVDAVTSRLWRDPAQRGASAAFCHWWQQNSGLCCWPEIIHAFQTADDDPWNDLTGLSFAETYRLWTVSNVTDGIPSRQFGQNLPPRMMTLKSGDDWSHTITGTATLYVKLNERDASRTPWTIRIQTDDQLPVQITRVRVPRQSSAEHSLVEHSAATAIR